MVLVPRRFLTAAQQLLLNIAERRERMYVRLQDGVE